MTELDAVRAYRTMAPPTLDPQASHSDATWLLSLADAAIAALEATIAAEDEEIGRYKKLYEHAWSERGTYEAKWGDEGRERQRLRAENEALRRQVEALKVCGNCNHWWSGLMGCAMDSSQAVVCEGFDHCKVFTQLADKPETREPCWTDRRR